MNSENIQRLKGMIGLCARARKLAIGTDIAIDSVRNSKSKLLLLAFDASQNSKKKVLNCAGYYNIPCYEIPIGISELGHCTGKSGNTAAVAVLDRNMINGINKIINETNEQTSKADNGPWEV